MNLKKIFFSAVTVSVLCALTGCDYIEEGKPESSLLKQQEEHNNKIVLLEKQQAQLKSQLETIQKQQTDENYQEIEVYRYDSSKKVTSIGTCAVKEIINIIPLLIPLKPEFSGLNFLQK